MRAGRLVSLLLLLQTRGRMTAQALADELEVSVRTVYRDVESLGASGVPIYADRGPDGGYQLLDGYRTRLTGLTGDEAGTLFLAGLPGPAAELGLGSVLAAAELKLRASLPDELAIGRTGYGNVSTSTRRAGSAGTSRRRTLPRWPTRCGARGSCPCVSAMEGAARGQPDVVAARSGAQGRPVVPGGRVGPAKITAYRVSNILDAVVLDEPVERPAGFDLTAFWREWTERFEGSVYTASATVRMTESALEMMAFVFPPEMSRRARAAAGNRTPPGGWSPRCRSSRSGTDTSNC